MLAWESYLSVFNKAHRGKETTLIETLTNQFTTLGTVKLLQEGRKSAPTKKIAEELQLAQFARW
ncbi:hypothetical protein GN244_ATG16404 [Phytophthora infestans]|nr:hypothetical protein GN244_ATG16404 [Phytophthora infestans]